MVLTNLLLVFSGRPGADFALLVRSLRELLLLRVRTQSHAVKPPLSDDETKTVDSAVELCMVDLLQSCLARALENFPSLFQKPCFASS